MERLQKIISRAGLTSRRASEALIAEGRVRVNGRVVTELGAKADPRSDRIEVDGKRLVPEAPVYLVLHKPRGVVSTLSDPEGRPTVAELVRGAPGRVYPVGRLDFATSGVLLMTNDGDFANGLLHPRGGVPKTYVVKTQGLMDDEALDRWRSGVELEDGKTLPAEVRFLRHEDDKTWFEVTLREGRNQQIRRMGDATGFRVMRLARVSFADVTVEGLRPGHWRPLTYDELHAIKKRFGVPKRLRTAAQAQPAVRSERGGRPARGELGARPTRGRAHGDDRRERPGREERGRRRPREDHEAAPPRAGVGARPARDGGGAGSRGQERGGQRPRDRHAPKPERSARDAKPPRVHDRSAPRPRSGAARSPRPQEGRAREAEPLDDRDRRRPRRR